MIFVLVGHAHSLFMMGDSHRLLLGPPNVQDRQACIWRNARRGRFFRILLRGQSHCCAAY